MSCTASFDLDRFVAAQSQVYDQALAELTQGQKRSHWMWFVFPQMRGLGMSATAEFFGIVSLDEARTYLAHEVLGHRLMACTQAVLATEQRSLRAIFGSPDDVKFGSSMTLFEQASDGAQPEFGTALDRFCGGQRDKQTLALIGT